MTIMLKPLLTSFVLGALALQAPSAWAQSDKPLCVMVGFPAGGSPADLQKTMAEDTRRWAPVVRKSGFKAD